MKMAEEHNPSGGYLRDGTKFSLLAGLIVVAGTFGGIAAWSSAVPLSEAIITSGTLQVETRRKAIQHLEGGIIGEILVEDGDVVAAGDVLVRLDDTTPKASLSLIRGQLDELHARAARLRAEQEEQDQIQFPAVLEERNNVPDVAAIMTGQVQLFRARREGKETEIDLLKQRQGQLRQQIQGIIGQRTSKTNQIAILEQELKDLQGLFDKGLAPVARLLALRREAEQQRGEEAALIADLARAHSAIGEAELEIVRLKRNFRESVVTELRDVSARINEIEERRIAAEDMLRRTTITAPRSGIVLSLNVHTIGGVIAAGEPLMEIVPADDPLVLAARVRPQDIDKVLPGLAAEIRFSSFSQRTTPVLHGVVKRVSADQLTDRATGQPYYLGIITIPADQIARLEGLELVPGMPAEAFISTGERTAISYLLKPLSDSFRRALREE